MKKNLKLLAALFLFGTANVQGMYLGLEFQGNHVSSITAPITTSVTCTDYSDLQKAPNAPTGETVKFLATNLPSALKNPKFLQNVMATVYGCPSTVESNGRFTFVTVAKENAEKLSEISMVFDGGKIYTGSREVLAELLVGRKHCPETSSNGVVSFSATITRAASNVPIIKVDPLVVPHASALVGILG